MPMILRLQLYIFFMLIGIITASHAQVPGFFIKDGSRRVVMPFTQVNHLIILPISINGGPSLNFLFDTGVKSNILFSKTIGDQLGLTYSRKLNLIGADGQTVLTASVSTNNHLDLGKVEGTLQAILVLDDDFLNIVKFRRQHLYVIIGYEFFKLTLIKVDYEFSGLIIYVTEAIRWIPFSYRVMNFLINNNKDFIFY